MNKTYCPEPPPTNSKHMKKKHLLTTALIGVKVSCPLAKVHGRPADCKLMDGEYDKKINGIVLFNKKTSRD
jgi:hypothetical protein